MCGCEGLHVAMCCGGLSEMYPASHAMSAGIISCIFGFAQPVTKVPTPCLYQCLTRVHMLNGIMSLHMCASVWLFGFVFFVVPVSVYLLLGTGPMEADRSLWIGLQSNGYF